MGLNTYNCKFHPAPADKAQDPISAWSRPTRYSDVCLHSAVVSFCTTREAQDILHHLQWDSTYFVNKHPYTVSDVTKPR